MVKRAVAAALVFVLSGLMCGSWTGMTRGRGNCLSPMDNSDSMWMDAVSTTGCTLTDCDPYASTPVIARMSREDAAHCEGCLLYIMGSENGIGMPHAHEIPYLTSQGFTLHFLTPPNSTPMSFENWMQWINDVKSRVPVGKRGPYFVADMRFDLLNRWLMDMTGDFAPQVSWFLQTDRPIANVGAWAASQGGTYSHCRMPKPGNTTDQYNDTRPGGDSCNRAFGAASPADATHSAGEYNVTIYDQANALQPGLGDKLVYYMRADGTDITNQGALMNLLDPSYQDAVVEFCATLISQGVDACDFGHKRQQYWEPNATDPAIKFWVDTGDGLGGMVEDEVNTAIDGTMDTIAEFAVYGGWSGPPEIPNGVAGCVTVGGCPYKWKEYSKGEVEVARKSYARGNSMVRQVTPYLFVGCPKAKASWDSAYADAACENPSRWDDPDPALREGNNEREVGFLMGRNGFDLIPLGGKTLNAASVGSGGGAGWSFSELRTILSDPPFGGPRAGAVLPIQKAGYPTIGTSTKLCGAPAATNPDLPKLAAVIPPAFTANFVTTKIQGGSCAAPCAVHFKSDSPTPGTLTRGFHSVTDEWDFGDPTSGNYVTGKTRNVAYGAVAGHLYNTPGTYTVTLRRRMPNGTVFETGTDTVTVLSPSGATGLYPNTQTTCLGKAALPVAGTAGCPAGAAVVQRADGNAYAAILAIGTSTAKRISFARKTPAETWTFGTTISLGAAGGIIDSYDDGSGTALLPAITATNNLFNPGNGWTVAGLDVNFTADAAIFPDFSAVGDRIGVTLYNTKIRGKIMNVYNGGPTTRSQNKIAIVDVDAVKTAITQSNQACTTTGVPFACCTGLGTGTCPSNTTYCFFGPTNTYLNLGNTCDLGALASDNVQFGMRHNGLQDFAIEDGIIKGVGGNQPYNAIQLRTGADGVYPTHTGIISGMVLDIFNTPVVFRTCEAHGCDCPGAGGTSQGNLFYDVIFENNFIYARPGTAGVGNVGASLFWLQGRDTTIRNNIIDGQGMATGVPSGGNVNVVVHDASTCPLGSTVVNNIQVLSNTFYGGASPAGTVTFCASESGTTGMECRGNMTVRNSGTMVDGTSGWTKSNNPTLTTSPFATTPGSQGTTTGASFALASGNATAKGQGFDASAQTSFSNLTDFSMNCRPAFTTWDAGALEQGAGPCPP